MNFIRISKNFSNNKNSFLRNIRFLSKKKKKDDKKTTFYCGNKLCESEFILNNFKMKNKLNLEEKEEIERLHKISIKHAMKN